jgi:hypothetical protein
MGRSVWAIAGLTVRHAVRSRVVALLGVGVLAAVLGVPLALRSDGTATGHVQLLLYYSLGLAGLLLSLAAVWTGAGAVSLELENRHAPLLACKPVHAWQLWLGKWGGLLILNGLLLGAAGALGGLALAWSVRGSASWSESDRHRLAEEILVARRDILPEPEDLAGPLARRAEDLRREGRLPEGPLPPDAAAELLRDLRREAATVRPGSRKVWTFRVPGTAGHGRPLTLRFRFDGSSDGPLATVAVLWEIAGPDGTVLFRHEGEFAPGAAHTIILPADVAATAGGRLSVAYGNVAASGASTVIFPVEGGVSLQAYAGPFLPNYLRALVVMFCRLAILSALGLTLGCCFSFPVASFVTFSLLLFSSIEDWTALPVGTDATLMAAMAWRWPAVGYLLAGLDAVIAPLYRLEPLSNLSVGLLVSWSFTGRALADAGLYGAALLLVGAGLFRRRELGLFA